MLCLFYPRTRDQEWIDSDQRPGVRINIPDHIFESFETIFGLKILKFFAADLDPGYFLPWIRETGWKIQI
jgi:hypothetical protein